MFQENGHLYTPTLGVNQYNFGEGVAIFTVSKLQMCISFDRIILLRRIYSSEMYSEVCKDILITLISYV